MTKKNDTTTAEENQELSFEEAYAILDKCCADISKESLSLEESISAYEEGIKYYNICKSKLDNAKQRVEFIDKEEIK